jgi:hypothetical protein
MKKRKNMGCNEGLRKMGVLLVVLNMCWGEGEWMDWVGVISTYI